MDHCPSHRYFSKADRYPLEAVFSHRPTLLKDIFLKNRCSGSPAEAFLSKTSVRGVPPKHFSQKQVFGESRRSIFLKNKRLKCKWEQSQQKGLANANPKEK